MDYSFLFSVNVVFDKSLILVIGTSSFSKERHSTLIRDLFQLIGTVTAFKDDQTLKYNFILTTGKRFLDLWKPTFFIHIFFTAI